MGGGGRGRNEVFEAEAPIQSPCPNGKFLLPQSSVFCVCVRIHRDTEIYIILF